MAKTNSNRQYESILISIAANASSRVDGVASLAGESGGIFRKHRKNTGVEVFIENNTVIVDVCIYAFSEHAIPDVAYNIQCGVKNEIESATQFKVKSVNVRVVGVVFSSGI